MSSLDLETRLITVSSNAKAINKVCNLYLNLKRSSCECPLMTPNIYQILEPLLLWRLMMWKNVSFSEMDLSRFRCNNFVFLFFTFGTTNFRLEMVCLQCKKVVNWIWCWDVKHEPLVALWCHGRKIKQR